MTQSTAPTENVVGGALLALLVVPVGVALWVAVESAGVVIGFVAFGISFGAYWLYQRGAGGVISRTGAWIVTAIVVATLALSILFGMMADYAIGVGANYGLSPWDVFFSPVFWPNFARNFGALFGANVTFYLIAIAIAALGAFRTLQRAFRATAPVSAVAAYPPAPTAGGSPRSYRDDIDAAPTGSADDKTTPPTVGN
jgi:hypothetical protein